MFSPILQVVVIVQVKLKSRLFRHYPGNENGVMAIYVFTIVDPQKSLLAVMKRQQRELTALDRQGTQQRPESPAVTLTSLASKYKVRKLYQLFCLEDT